MSLLNKEYNKNAIFKPINLHKIIIINIFLANIR